MVIRDPIVEAPSKTVVEAQTYDYRRAHRKKKEENEEEEEEDRAGMTAVGAPKIGWIFALEFPLLPREGIYLKRPENAILILGCVLEITKKFAGEFFPISAPADPLLTRGQKMQF